MSTLFHSFREKYDDIWEGVGAQPGSRHDAPDDKLEGDRLEACSLALLERRSRFLAVFGKA